MRNGQTTGRNDRLWTILCHASTCTYESKCASSTGKQIGKTAVKRKKARAWVSSTAPTPANNSNSPHVNDRGELAVDEGEHDQRTDVAEEANAHITNKNIIKQINQKDANMKKCDMPLEVREVKQKKKKTDADERNRLHPREKPFLRKQTTMHMTSGVCFANPCKARCVV